MQRNYLIIQIICGSDCAHFLIFAWQKYYFQRLETRKLTDCWRWILKISRFQLCQDSLNQNIYTLWYPWVSCSRNYLEPRPWQSCWLVDFGHSNLLDERWDWSLHWWRPNDNLPKYFKRQSSIPQRYGSLSQINYKIFFSRRSFKKIGNAQEWRIGH